MPSFQVLEAYHLTSQTRSSSLSVQPFGCCQAIQEEALKAVWVSEIAGLSFAGQFFITTLFFFSRFILFISFPLIPFVFAHITHALSSPFPISIACRSPISLFSRKLIAPFSRFLI
jgi:hypothetical protein